MIVAISLLHAKENKKEIQVLWRNRDVNILRVQSCCPETKTVVHQKNILSNL